MSVTKRFAIGLAAAAGLTLAAAPLASAGVPASGPVYDEWNGFCYFVEDGVALGNLWVGQTNCVHQPDVDLVSIRTGEVAGKNLGSINIPGGPGIAAAWWY